MQKLRMYVPAAAAVALLFASSSSASPQATPVVIWAGSAQKASIEKSAAAWGKAPVVVAVHEAATIRNDLAAATPASAPDVVAGQNDLIGDLVPSGTLLPLYPSQAVKRQFPRATLDALSYGIALKRLYGAPFAVDNVGLVVNTALARVPKTFAQLEREAVAFKRRKSGNVGIAVPEASVNDAAYYTFPFFSGLGGYVFGKNTIGLLDPSNIGVANGRFVRNSALIDRWNREGLFNSRLDYASAKSAFLAKRAAFWIAGPAEAESLKSSGLALSIVQVPKLKQTSAPLLGVQGLMVTKYATGHGIDTLARDFVAGYLMSPAAQLDLAQAGGRAPANTRAAAKYQGIAARFGRAGRGGVPLPNIPQMSSVWGELGAAWIKSTQGVGSTRARVAFAQAARNIRQKIG